MSDRPTFLKSDHLLLAGITVASAAVFIIDIQFPLGFAWVELLGATRAALMIGGGGR